MIHYLLVIVEVGAAGMVFVIPTVAGYVYLARKRDIIG